MVRRRNRRAFTLLEVMVATVLMSIVALVTYASARVSFDGRVRVAGVLRTTQSARASRELLQDALRNTQAPRQPEDSTFILHGDRLSFVAAGAGPPFDADCDWRIGIEPDSGSLQVHAVPIGRALPFDLRFRLSGVTRWDVRVLGDDGNWTSEWPSATNLPRAISISLWDGRVPAGPPVRVALAPSTTSRSLDLGSRGHSSAADESQP